MMFWIIAGVVAAVLFALAWWSSGRSRSDLDGRRADHVRGDAQGKSAYYGGRPNESGSHNLFG